MRLLCPVGRYSGITSAMLANVSTTVSDVQHQLRQLLPPTAILVGHSLENDLRALKVRVCLANSRTWERR